ncbi:hypothetical protein PFISCL1PPCAC_25488, partial [Pristionchus fissidentatus]
TRLMILFYWILAIVVMTFMLKYVDCSFYLPHGAWFFVFKTSPVCQTIEWYGDFILNCSCVIIVATMDVSAILRVHCITASHIDAGSLKKRSRQRNLVYQAALQSIFFISELITYFLISRYAQNKWQAFALTSVSWCLVNGMDGLIVLVYNRDFRGAILKLV